MVSAILTAIDVKVSASSSGMLVPFYQTTLRQVPQDSNPRPFRATPKKLYGVDEIFTLPGC
jgi:hypothetical protein